ncbi:sulfite reductase subunit alpha [Planctomycetes bacterium K23_9]|uniref:assimilatory sulfite reductase (NADPH) n=1 Tax=Stieleria marina TaxID=1930275 RepID=A0A517P2X1_9BACT|nr:Sulfite reductase [NADPH] flavoprotein alpha-component [Planctomycetes bacterium K23_9]
MIPETPLLSDAQHAWLNGFVTGFLGVEPTLVSDGALAAAGLTTETVIKPSEPDEEDFPWHQPELPIVQRLAMADGRPLNRRLMAAMAQLNCGSCGYECQTYSEAIAAGNESDLTLCSPGGKETKQMLKSLVKESGGINQVGPIEQATVSSGYSRRRPFPAKLIGSEPLNRSGSAKDTRHVAIDLAGSQLEYTVGDALGAWPTNSSELVASIVQLMDVDPVDEVVTPLGHTKLFATALCEDCCLKDPTDELLQRLLSSTNDETAKHKLGPLLDKGVPEGVDVLDVLQMTPDVRLKASELVECLESIKPRLYSIASSMKAVGAQVHLTVGKVSYQRDDRLRLGVASTMFAERLHAGDKVKVFVHPNRSGFTVPSDSTRPMIMIGPGTGIAPFIAFLQEREAVHASGKNWLFFGDQHEAFDFLYEQKLQDWLAKGTLAHLSTAFSRDGNAKVYVQDRMRQHGERLWQWIEEGAAIFVCGDASRMAADVDQALVGICQKHGRMNQADAHSFVARLKEKQRYVRDVY